MSSTPRASIPLLSASQAQKHVTHNDALIELDALLCCRVLDRDLSTPPGSPADGDAYLVHASPTGAWTGQAGNIAYCVDGAWRFAAPFEGLSLFVADEVTMLVYHSGSWQSWVQVLSFQNLAMLGINTTADITNRLAVKSAAVLFDNIGNGVQTKLNKNAAADTASLLYQTGYSGRAEIGLTGDDDFHFKVSSDGATWYGALTLARASGQAQLTAGSVSVPALSTSGDTNTGLYFPAADTLAFATGGVKRVQIDASGILTAYAGILADTNLSVSHGNGAHNENIAIGYQVMGSVTGLNNTGMGYQALKTLTSGVNNTAVGYQAMYSLTTGNNNFGLGYSALYYATTAAHNIGIGTSALLNGTGEAYNVAIGSNALQNETGSYNVAIGFVAGHYLTGAVNNVILGANAVNGTGFLTNANGIFLGYSVSPAADATSYEVVIGSGLAGNGSNTTTFAANPLYLGTKKVLNGDGTLQKQVFTVATLPTGADGKCAFVSDSTLAASGNFGAAVTGGGSNHVPVYYDAGASTWRIG
jgi:hypothetical protein